jgi:hypothetical protein
LGRENPDTPPMLRQQSFQSRWQPRRRLEIGAITIFAMLHEMV